MRAILSFERVAVVVAAAAVQVVVRKGMMGEKRQRGRQLPSTAMFCGMLRLVLAVFFVSPRTPI